MLLNSVVRDAVLDSALVQLLVVACEELTCSGYHGRNTTPSLLYGRLKLEIHYKNFFLTSAEAGGGYVCCLFVGLLTE